MIRIKITGLGKEQKLATVATIVRALSIPFEEAAKISNVLNMVGIYDIECDALPESNKFVIFEYPEIDLCELLKDCIGMKFYMPTFGYVSIMGFPQGEPKTMLVQGPKTNLMAIQKDGKLRNSNEDCEICIFPSKEQRNWSLFQPPWVPKEGERVWVRNEEEIWSGRYFHKMEDKKYFCYRDQNSEGNSIAFKECVPFEPIPW